MKKMTDTHRLRLLRKAVELQVMELLQWDDLEYCYYKYECGLQYLRLCYDKQRADELGRLDIFWGWWKMMWFKLELVILQADREAYIHDREEWTVETARAVYTHAYDPGKLARTITVSDVVEGKRVKSKVA